MGLKQDNNAPANIVTVHEALILYHERYELLPANACSSLENELNLKQILFCFFLK